MIVHHNLTGLIPNPKGETLSLKFYNDISRKRKGMCLFNNQSTAGMAENNIQFLLVSRRESP